MDIKVTDITKVNRDNSPFEWKRKRSNLACCNHRKFSPRDLSCVSPSDICLEEISRCAWKDVHCAAEDARECQIYAHGNVEFIKIPDFMNTMVPNYCPCCHLVKDHLIPIHFDPRSCRHKSATYSLLQQQNTKPQAYWKRSKDLGKRKSAFVVISDAFGEGKWLFVQLSTN